MGIKKMAIRHCRCLKKHLEIQPDHLLAGHGKKLIEKGKNDIDK